MKKAYETPSVEKIAFNYRDQVVAASGDPQNQSGITGSNSSGGEQFIQRVAPGLSISGCTSDYECSVLADFIG